MVRASERPTIPYNSVERVIRMSVERGRLAHLVFDAGESTPGWIEIPWPR